MTSSKLHVLAVALTTILGLGCGVVGAQESSGQPAPDKPGKGAAPDTAQESERHFMRSGDDWDQQLAAQLPDQVLWLEAPSQRFVGLVRREQGGDRQGGALILAEPGSSPAKGWAQGLREVLPEGGWYTLVVPVASEAREVLPKRVLPAKGAATPQTKEKGNADPAQEAPSGAVDSKPAQGGGGSSAGVTIDVAAGRTALRGEDYQRYVFERIEAGLTHLREQGYQNLVLVGVGESAQWMTRYLAANDARFGPRGVGLVWVAPRFGSSAEKLFDEVLGADFDRPVLDLVPEQDRQSIARRAAARRQGLGQYTQDRMAQAHPTSDAAARGLAQRIKGWLRKRMRGMQAKQ
ncbi:DUF3530 family protein [Marinobacteraceae bacterium S3BR75-40.1]